MFSGGSSAEFGHARQNPDIYASLFPRPHRNVLGGTIACAKVPVALVGGLLMARAQGHKDFYSRGGGSVNDCSCTLAVNDSQSGGGLQTLRVWALKGNSSRECH